MESSAEIQSSNPEISTERFARRIRKLDLSALSSLHDDFYLRLYRYAYYCLGQRQASQEIAAETYLKLVGEIRQHSALGNLPGFLFANSAEQVQAAFQSPQAWEEQAGPGKYSPLFRRSLRKLQPELRHFLALRFTQEASLQEIGLWLGQQERELRALQFQALNGLLGTLGGQPILQSEEPMERALQVCIQNLEKGGRVDELAASYPKWREQLHALLEVARFSQYPGGIDPRQPAQPKAGPEDIEDARERSKAEFLQAAQVRIGRPQPAKLVRRTVVSLIVLCLLAACAAALAAGSINASPGSPFYGAKRGFEELRWSITVDPAARMQVAQRYDQRRLAEVAEILQLGQVRQVVFSGLLEQDPLSGWKAGGVPLLVSPETEILGTLRPGFSVTVQGDTTSDGAVQARQLQMRELQVQGAVQSLSEYNLDVDGLQVVVTPETIWQGQAEAGSRVNVYLLLPGNGVPVARLVEVIKP